MFEKPIVKTLLVAVTAMSAVAGQSPFPLPTVKIQVERAPIFEFCVIPLEIGAEPFAAREFWLGGREAQGFREPPTRTRLAGSMVLEIGGKLDWCVLLGKTEVTLAQWHGIMGTPVPSGVDGQLSVTRISRAEVAMFLEKLNESFKRRPAGQAINSSLGGSFDDAFIRLPFENEWEFAARGGPAVDDNTFDKSTPYPDELNRHEWFFSQASSKGKLKQVGLLEPNPLGLCDMLGNTSEMVESYYQTEYSQGRLGGGIARGGDFRTDEKDVRSSKRMELPLVFQDGEAYKNGTVGLRLAIGSLVIPSMAAGKKLEDVWRDYSIHRMQPSTAPPSISSVSETSDKELEEINELIKSMGKRLELAEGGQTSAKQALSEMEVRTASILGNMERANRNFAAGAVRLTSKISTNYLAYCANFLLAREAMVDPALRAGSDEMKSFGANKRINELKMNEEASAMEDILKMFGEIPIETVDSSFDEFLRSLQGELSGIKSGKNSEEMKTRIESRIEATQVARESVLDYVTNRRMDLDGWRLKLSTSARKRVEQVKRTWADP